MVVVMVVVMVMIVIMVVAVIDHASVPVPHLDIAARLVIAMLMEETTSGRHDKRQCDE